MNKEKIGKFHRDNILTAADSLFKEQGFDATTIEQIAKKAEYSKPTIYSYFASKEDIYAYILYKYMMYFNDEIHKMLDSNQRAADTYLGCCRAVLSFKLKNPVYFDGIIGAINYKSDSTTDTNLSAIGELAAAINTKICDLFSRAEEEKLIVANTDVRFAYSFIWSCVIGLINSRKFRLDYPSDGDYFKALDRAFLKILDGFGVK